MEETLQLYVKGTISRCTQGGGVASRAFGKMRSLWFILSNGGKKPLVSPGNGESREMRNKRAHCLWAGCPRCGLGGLEQWACESSAVGMFLPQKLCSVCQFCFLFDGKCHQKRAFLMYSHAVCWASAQTSSSNSPASADVSLVADLGKSTGNSIPRGC